MKGIQRKQQWYMLLTMFFVIVCVSMSVSIGYSQVKVMKAKGKKAVERRYEISGRLSAVNLKEKWALIGGLKWSLTDNFDAKEFAAVWGRGVKKGGIIEFTDKQKSWVDYYVILKTYDLSSLDKEEKETDEKGIRLIVDSHMIVEIYEQGGKIYQIVPCGM